MIIIDRIYFKLDEYIEFSWFERFLIIIIKKVEISRLIKINANQKVEWKMDCLKSFSIKLTKKIPVYFIKKFQEQCIYFFFLKTFSCQFYISTYKIVPTFFNDK